LAGADTNLGVVHSSSTAVSSGSLTNGADTEVFLGCLSAETALRSVRVVLNGWLTVLEGSVIVVGSGLAVRLPALVANAVVNVFTVAGDLGVNIGAESVANGVVNVSAVA